MGEFSQVNWTDQQRAAMTTTGCNLLVSAAAGSGKTAVLAERCAHLVCDAAPPCGVEEILVVTFTEAAAAEMKQRIDKTLRTRLESGPADDPRLLRQLALIEYAPISTLHAFCFRLLRQNFHRAGLDPNFAIFDEDEANLLRLETAREVFADRYEAENSAAFERFIDAYGDGDDEPIMQRVINAYSLLRSLADPQSWLLEARRRLAEPAAKPLAQTAIGKELAQLIREKIDRLLQHCAQARQTLSDMRGFAPYAQCVQKIHDIVTLWEHAARDGDFDALARQMAEFKMPRKPSMPLTQPGRAAAEAVLEAVRDEIQEDSGGTGPLQELGRFNTAQWLEGLRASQGAAELFLDLVEEFARRYSAAKQHVHKLDFSDLEVYSLKILCDGAVRLMRASAVARGCHRQFKHVLVDEYQDINEVQDAILHMVSTECLQGTPHREPGNLFCVGDVKQSIYGFRLAEPMRFLQRDREFRQPASSAGRVIDLQSNFRSRGPLLASLNALFERLISRETADIDYDPAQRLHAGLQYPPPGEVPSFAGAPVELHVLPAKIAEQDADGGDDEEFDRTQREAAFIAHRIHEMMGHMDGPQMHIADKTAADPSLQLRPLRWRDIVVLLRSMRFKADSFTRILSQHRIPTHRDSGSGFFDSMEVRDVLSLLHLLDNQCQDIPLAAVLRSPLSGPAATDDDLARIVLAAAPSPDPIPFYQAVTLYAQRQHDELGEGLRNFLETLAGWRRLAQTRPPADLIWKIYDQTGYLAWCSGLDNGQQRATNLVELHERARQFGLFSRQSLYRFLRFLESLEEESDLGQPSVLSQANDVVRVMSIHRAKGLEFPVVFLADLGKRFNLANLGGPILVDRRAYLGLAAADERRLVRYPTAASLLVRSRLRRQTTAEELRLLYVAATRAREHLVLVGTARPSAVANWQNHAARPGPLPAGLVLGANSMLDWIGPAAAAIADPRILQLSLHEGAEIADCLSAEIPGQTFSVQQENLARLAPLEPPPPDDPLAQMIVRRLQGNDAFAAYTQLAAAQSVTALAKHGKPTPMAGDRDALAAALDRALPLPRWIAEQNLISAADVGTATHLALQYLDFARSCRGPDLEEQLRDLRDRRLILSSHLQRVDRSAIAWFLDQDLGIEIRKNAAKLRREVPFYLALGPERFELPPSAAKADQVMLRGRIDLLIERGAGYVVVDYKTDRLDETAEALKERVEFYTPQVQLYREAIEKITLRKVLGVYLVFLSGRKICET